MFLYKEDSPSPVYLLTLRYIPRLCHSGQFQVKRKTSQPIITSPPVVAALVRKRSTRSRSVNADMAPLSKIKPRLQSANVSPIKTKSPSSLLTQSHDSRFLSSQDNRSYRGLTSIGETRSSPTLTPSSPSSPSVSPRAIAKQLLIEDVQAAEEARKYNKLKNVLVTLPYLTITDWNDKIEKMGS